MFYCILGGILFIMLGLFIFKMPNLIWKYTEKWKSYSADEPSDFYIISTKFSGILFFIFGLGMIILPLILK